MWFMGPKSATAIASQYDELRNHHTGGPIPTEASLRSGELAHPINGWWENSTVLSVGFHRLADRYRDETQELMMGHGLFENGHDPQRGGLALHLGVVNPGNQESRNIHTLFGQTLNHLQSGHPRHVLIDNQTGQAIETSIGK